jgi:hypothetical protein
MPLTLTRSAAGGGVIGTLVLLLAACSATDTGEAQRRRDMVLVPEDAAVVDAIRWSDVRTVKPLNRRMVLFRSRDRHYLLVLARPCPGLREDSIVVTRSRDRIFDPNTDTFDAVDPFPTNSGIVATCIPDTLYAIRDEDVDWLEESLARQ